MNDTTDNRAIGSIDHLVIAVSDLESSAQRYRQLGFTLSPKGVHSAALGTVNHTIMLQNDYFELLAVAHPTERNEHWRETLAIGPGLAGMAMTTNDAPAARKFWLQAGLSPDATIQFSRAVPRPDGRTMEARFEVVSLDQVPGTGLHLFVCSQPTREAVWLPELMTHANGATRLRRIHLACPDPDFSARQWQRVLPHSSLRKATAGLCIDTGRHEIRLTQSSSAGPRALGIDFAVADLDRCRELLSQGDVPYADEATGIVVNERLADGVRLRFEAETG